MRFLVLAAIGLAVLAGTARAAGPPVLGFSVSSGASSAPATALPSAASPNLPGSIAVPVSFTSPPASPEVLALPALHLLWQRASAAYGIPWQVLAAINKIESNFGQNMGPSSAGAVGWMQFMPSTWLRWGVDADGDGIADPWNATDAIFSAARYLAAAGGQTDIARSVFSYNHADWYVREVLDLARVYGGGGITQTVDLQQLQAKLDDARRAVVDANAKLQAAREREGLFRRVSQRLHGHVEAAALLSDRLAAERKAALYDVNLNAARETTAEAGASLQQAQDALATATQNVQAPSFAPGVGTLMSAAAYQDGYVFPVGGGPQLVSVAHTHHDYPAADIAAPAGSPVYALADADVVNALAHRRSALRHRHDDPHQGRARLDVLPPRLPRARGRRRCLPGRGNADRPRRLDRTCDRPAPPSAAAAADRVPAGPGLVRELRRHGVPVAGRSHHARAAGCDSGRSARLLGRP